MSNWTIFSNHGHVLVCLSRDPQARLRDVAANVGITERAVQKIVRDLQDVGMISVTKNGRRNSYRIHQKKTLRHDIEAGCTLKDLIKVVNKTSANQAVQKGVPRASFAEDRQPKVESSTVKPVSSKMNVSGKAVESSAKKVVKKKKKQNKDGERKKIERQQGSLF